MPSALLDRLRQGKVNVINWHALAWESEEQIKKRKCVDNRGVKGDEAYTREVLGHMAAAPNILVINDEAHHACRVNWEAERKYPRQRDLTAPRRPRSGLAGSIAWTARGASSSAMTFLLLPSRHQVRRAPRRPSLAGSSATLA